MSTGREQLNPEWLKAVGRQRKNVSVGLLALALVLAVVAIALGYKKEWEYAPTIVGLGLGTLIALGAGLWYRLGDEGEASPDDAARLLVLIVGGLAAIDVFLVWIYLLYRWWSPYIIGGTEAWQGEGGWRIWVVALLGPAALGLGFVSLLLARTEAEAHPVRRRLLYGYNAVLTGMLVLMILVLINILGYVYLPPASDWTKSQIYTLDTRSENILKGLEKPLHITVLVNSRETQEYSDIMSLLDNARSVSDKVDVSLVLPTRQPAAYNELVRRYGLTDRQGLLVVYGTESDEQSQFLRMSDLYTTPMMMMGMRGGERTFQGEDALMTAVAFLEEGKQKPIIYFTQGHGELDVSGVGNELPERRAQNLRSRLEKNNFQVKGLRLGGGLPEKAADPTRVVVSKTVPDDAGLVVVAGPQSAFAQPELDALREYMNPKEAGKKKGKLILLLDVVAGPNERMLQTGLEALAAEMGVEVTNDRVLQPNLTNPDVILVLVNPRLPENNPLAAPLRGVAVPMFDIRSIKPRQGPQAGGYQAEILLIATSNSGLWPEPNLGDPVRLVAQYQRNDFRDVESKAERALPVGVIVTEGGMAGPHGAMTGDQKPRLVVIGDAGFISDQPLPGVGERGVPEIESRYYSLFASSVAWLRERPNNIGIEPRKRDEYKMNDNTDMARLLLQPGSWMFAGIVGLGLGVWVVRRR